MVTTGLPTAEAAEAAEDEAIGRIKTSAGELFLVNGATRRPAEIGAILRRIDTIETGRDGLVGLALTDNSILSTGPNSELIIRDYKFNSSAFNGSMRARLNRGTMAVTSVDIARGSPEAMQVETPMGSINGFQNSAPAPSPSCSEDPASRSTA
jgi:hypothetical protein